MKTKFNIAYFSAEIGISSSLPTYSGGLGVLAGDHIKAAGDIGLNMCAITLLYREGYFKQRIDEDGIQTETYPRFDPDPLLKKMDLKFTLRLRDRDVWVQVYRFDYMGQGGHIIPLFFLDTDVEENYDDDRNITLRLYSGDKDHRILQEAILGFGGTKLLDELGQNEIETFHMNEGHCSFLVLDLLDKYNGDVEKVKSKCHFTTHTPVAAGHDHFAESRVKKLLKGLLPEDLELPSLVNNGRLHMTELGLYFSRTANGVSKLHGTIAQNQFSWKNIGYITNGVHHSYWMGSPFKRVFDEYLPHWRTNPNALLEIEKVPDEVLLNAHQVRKEYLLGFANSQVTKALDGNTLTIGFARRAATYKRAQLLFNNLDKLKSIGAGKIQVVFSGKAHPNDSEGKEIIRQIVESSKSMFGQVKIIFLENYNMWLGRMITSGVDVWLNTPLRPNEASGTSGMKATLNGVPNLSVLDGWWAEGCKDGVNGWSVGDPDFPDDEKDANHLYSVLENHVIPVYYNNKEKWESIMKEAIKTGVEFTADRMIKEYNQKYYQVK
ncbi:MAG: alpha-glucan family phosphorylase [Candidatus Marinimicrobia bacterium]|jgi:starch phosphorylase|nr:alpha-glucan family phosphorylase [Candidatus Neomarinimicrobiota bacterium]MBT3937690.1 alpha-glucan family phosphorylase [Candidatus Neomarinimicrobiota bacterium]MBT4580099.1 alpha-glucan family phosphorylase [Candidatus Neomarinimicrobiota bacterium]MBT7900527.1 alpha-glucan family phosphorylase [Candidatus Neomarinimicrobiota bacterium]MBT7974347.1 alpha-glucan family phosphorylase [Candidatus Neomarinimicrobiota bacterium]